MSELRLTTVMKVDVRGSTELIHTFTEDQLREFLDEQKNLVTNLVTQHQGQVIKGEGDAFWIVFASVTSATLAAIRIHEELRARRLGIPDERRVALRIVIAAGDVLHHAHDIFGTAVNLAARIETITPADEIFLSHGAWLALNQAEIQTALVGEFSLKGFDEPQSVYKVVHLQRTIVLQDQVMAFADVRGFSVYQPSATTAEVETLLLYLEQVVRVACDEYGGTVRVFAGDTAIFTFSDAAPALSAVDALCRSWDEYVQAHAIPCPLLVGMHRGTLAVFRSFAFGDALKVSMKLNGLMRVIRHGTTASCVAISGQIREMVRGSEWDSRLRALEREQMPSDFGLGDIPVYELVRQ